jgi:CMP-N,N'-diacetyllegionaminic acid synthase
MYSFIALIPARAGSKGIKNKNLKKINNKSLTELAIDITKKSKIFDKIILSSDSKKILRLSSKYKIISHLRSKNLSSDKSNILDTILNIKEEFGFKKNFFLFIIEPTSPLRKVSQIKQAHRMIVKKKLDSFCTFTESMVSPFRIWKMKNKKLKPLLDKKVWVPRQTYKKHYQAVGNIIALNLTKFNKKNKKILFGKIGYKILKKIESIDIDSPDDLRIVRKLMKK